jgi:hypothetical protein
VVLAQLCFQVCDFSIGPKDPRAPDGRAPKVLGALLFGSRGRGASDGALQMMSLTSGSPGAATCVTSPGGSGKGTSAASLARACPLAVAVPGNVPTVARQPAITLAALADSSVRKRPVAGQPASIPQRC